MNRISSHAVSGRGFINQPYRRVYVLCLIFLRYRWQTSNVTIQIVINRAFDRDNNN